MWVELGQKYPERPPKYSLQVLIKPPHHLWWCPTNTFWEEWTCVSFCSCDFRLLLLLLLLFINMSKLDLKHVGASCLCYFLFRRFLVCFHRKVNHYGADMRKNMQCIYFWAWIVSFNIVFPVLSVFSHIFINLIFFWLNIILLCNIVTFSLSIHCLWTSRLIHSSSHGEQRSNEHWWGSV